MFVRFRFTPPYRVALSVVETRRIDGRVKHEHVASLSSIEWPPTVADRVAFWRRLHERLAKLGNRIDADAQARILGTVHERIPMVTVEEMRALAIENDKAAEQFHEGFRNLHAERIAGQKALIAKIERDIAADEAYAAMAGERASEAKGRRERLERGEDAPLNLRPPDVVKALKEGGLTASDIEHMERLTEPSERGVFEQFVAEVHRRKEEGRRIEKAVARSMLRRAKASGRA